MDWATKDRRRLITGGMYPCVPIFDRRFVYVPSYQTDIRATFARHGWVPNSNNGGRNDRNDRHK